MHPYDPHVAASLAYAPDIDLRDLPATRGRLADLLAAMPAYEPRSVASTLQARSADGSPVDVHLLTPRRDDDTPVPLLVWVHGGGFVFGDARESLPFLDRVTDELGIATASMQYRLSPEARFPAALEDVRAAVTELLDGPTGAGVDRARVAIGGQSAGGALAAGVALQVRDEGDAATARFALQVLDVPVTDDRVASESALAYTDTPLWNTRNARSSWEAYLGADGVGGAATSPYAAPARATDLRGLPPAVVTVNQYDPLRDEGIEYARRLAQAGVATELHLFPGTFHGSSAFAVTAPVSERHNSALLAAIAAGLAVAPTPAGPVSEVRS